MEPANLAIFGRDQFGKEILWLFYLQTQNIILTYTFIMEKINIELGNVQITLLLPLWGRAIETQKKNPLLIDKTALK